MYWTCQDNQHNLHCANSNQHTLNTIKGTCAIIIQCSFCFIQPPNVGNWYSGHRPPEETQLQYAYSWKHSFSIQHGMRIYTWTDSCELEPDTFINTPPNRQTNSKPSRRLANVWVSSQPDHLRHPQPRQSCAQRRPPHLMRLPTLPLEHIP